jgi:hypothetical protein
LGVLLWACSKSAVRSFISFVLSTCNHPVCDALGQTKPVVKCQQHWCQPRQRPPALLSLPPIHASPWLLVFVVIIPGKGRKFTIRCSSYPSRLRSSSHPLCFSQIGGPAGEQWSPLCNRLLLTSLFLKATSIFGCRRLS